MDGSIAEKWIRLWREGLQRKEYDYEGKDCREMNKIMKGRVAEKGIRLWRESLWTLTELLEGQEHIWKFRKT